MKMNASLAGIWIYVLMSLRALGESSLSIEPDRPLYIMETSGLKLDCTYKGDNGHIKWTKDRIPVNEEEFTMSTFRTASVISGKIQLVTTLTITKPSMDLGDSGRYACVSGTQVKTIRVRVLHVFTGGHAITDPGGSIRLKCDPDTQDVQVVWTKNNIPLTELPDLTGRYRLESRNTTLRILNASFSDSGEYECHIKPRYGVIQGNISAEVVLKGSPYFPDGHNITETVEVLDKTLELHCPAQGYPMPQVVWKRDGVRLNSSGDIQLLSYHGVSSAMLRIEQYFPEIGDNFVCEAVNQQGRTLRSFQVVYVNSAQVFHSTYFLLPLLSTLSVTFYLFGS